MKKNKVIHLIRFKISFILICILLLPALSASVNPNFFQPYIEKSVLGWRDWDKGEIYGVGRGYLKLNVNSKTRSARAAKTIAYGNVLKLAADIRLDDRLYLQNLAEGNFSVNLQALVHPKSSSQVFVDDPVNPYYEVTMVVPLNGIEGLVSKVVPIFLGKSGQDAPGGEGGVQPPYSGKGLDDEEEPWLVLDCRSLQGAGSVQPALFPKIVDEGGREIYGLKKVEPVALYKRGMARYVITEENLGQLQSGSSSNSSFVSQLNSLLFVTEAEASDKTVRRKRRRFIVKEVRESRGLNHTNLLISANDAKELTREDSASNILKKCRVIVVLASPSGGIDGRLHRYFAFATQ